MPVNASTDAVDEALGLLEVDDRRALADLGQDPRPERRRRSERQGVACPASCRCCPSRRRRRGRRRSGPRAARGSRTRGRRGCRSSSRSCTRRGGGRRGRDRPLAPERVRLRVGVAGQDVGDDVGRLRADHGLRLAASSSGVGPDDGAVGLGDLEDRRPRHQLAAVGDRAVGADHVDRVDLDRADAHRRDRHRVREQWMPKSFARSIEVVEAVHDPGLDRGDVQRELEGLPEADRAALAPCRPGSG